MFKDISPKLQVFNQHIDMLAALSPEQRFKTTTQMATESQGELTLLASVLEASFNDCRYLVSKKTKKTKQHIKHVSHGYNREDLVSIIFLNRPKSTQIKNPNKGGHHASPRPHKRRGTKYTLKALRYKNHPKYLINKAMFRRPAWIGPKEEIVNGITYTLI